MINITKTQKEISGFKKAIRVFESEGWGEDEEMKNEFIKGYRDMILARKKILAKLN